MLVLMVYKHPTQTSPIRQTQDTQRKQVIPLFKLNKSLQLLNQQRRLRQTNELLNLNHVIQKSAAGFKTVALPIWVRRTSATTFSVKRLAKELLEK